MKRIVLGAAMGMALVAKGGMADAAIIFGSAAIGADVQLFTEKGQQVAQDGGKAQTLPAAPLTASASLVRSGQVSGTGIGNGALAFTDAGRLTFSLSDVSMTIDNTGTKATSGYANVGSYYDFTVDQDTTISFDYSFTSAANNSGSKFPPSAQYTLRNPKMFIADGALADTGTLTLKTIGAGSYTLFLSGLSDVTVQGGGSGSASLSGFADVRFAQAAVPEPATWTTMIAGFGMAGAALRRRRTVRVVRV